MYLYINLIYFFKDKIFKVTCHKVHQSHMNAHKKYLMRVIKPFVNYNTPDNLGFSYQVNDKKCKIKELLKLF